MLDKECKSIISAVSFIFLFLLFFIISPFAVYGSVSESFQVCHQIRVCTWLSDGDIQPYD